MTALGSKNRYNERDYYLLVFKSDGTIYETFSHKWTANEFLKNHPLKEELELKINEKYVNGKG